MHLVRKIRLLPGRGAEGSAVQLHNILETEYGAAQRLVTFTIYVNKLRLLSVHCLESSEFCISLRLMHQEMRNRCHMNSCLSWLIRSLFSK